MMVKTGILKKLANDPSITKGKLSNVANDDLDDFLARFRAAGKPVRKPSDGMINTIEASLVARVPATDIVRFVLEGRLACVETGCEKLRFRSVFVCPAEILSAAEKVVSEKGLLPKDAAKVIGLPTTAMERLRKTIDLDGQPFLKGIEVANAHGKIRYCYAKEDLDRFCEEFVTLGELTEDAGTSTKSVSMKLAKAGIEPIMERSVLTAKVFRRKDL